MTDSFGTCPCCGNTLASVEGVQFRPEFSTLVSPSYSVTFSPYEGRLFNLFWRNRSAERVITKEMMLDELYGHDPNGGPDDGSKSIEVMMVHIRRRLKLTELEIVTIWGRGYLLRLKNKSAAPRIKGQARIVA